MNLLLRSLLLLPAFSAASLATTAFATVSIEFQFGAVNKPSGSIGAVVVDTSGNGFSNPGDSPGVLLTPGSILGGDDVVVAVLDDSNWPEWGSRRGFAEHFAVLDYESLGVEEGQPWILHIFPERTADTPLRSGEPFLSYLAEDLGGISSNSTMGSTLPPDGGAYLLSIIDQSDGGEADLSSIDISRLPLSGSFGDWSGALGSSQQRTYFFEMASPGFIGIRGIGSPGMNFSIFRGGSLVASGQGDPAFWFEDELGGGWHTLVIDLEPGSPPPGNYQIEFASAFLRQVLPDLALGRTLQSLQAAGTNLAPGADLRLISRRTRPVTAFATVANLGDRPEPLSVSARRGNRSFRVVYATAAGNSTALIASGRFLTRELSAGDPSIWIRSTVRPNRRRLTRRSGGRTRILRRTFSNLFMTRSTRQPAILDGGWIRISTR